MVQNMTHHNERHERLIPVLEWQHKIQEHPHEAVLIEYGSSPLLCIQKLMFHLPFWKVCSRIPAGPFFQIAKVHLLGHSEQMQMFYLMSSLLLVVVTTSSFWVHFQILLGVSKPWLSMYNYHCALLRPVFPTNCCVFCDLQIRSWPFSAILSVHYPYGTCRLKLSLC